MNFVKKLCEIIILNSKGKGNFNHIIWYWGALFYLISLSFFYNLNITIKDKFTLNFISTLLIIYLIWHIYISIKNFPKKTPLSSDEKKIQKLNSGGFSGAFFRKLFLQEPIAKIKTNKILILIDLFLILHFISFFKW
jgi:hypothetical protein